jgi:hypothetical protein
MLVVDDRIVMNDDSRRARCIDNYIHLLSIDYEEVLINVEKTVSILDLKTGVGTQDLTIKRTVPNHTFSRRCVKKGRSASL